MSTCIRKCLLLGWQYICQQKQRKKVYFLEQMWRNRNSYLQVGSTVWTPHTAVSLSIVYKVEAEPAWLWDSFHEEWIRKETGSGLIKCCSWSCRNSKRLCHDSILDDRTLDDFVFHQNTWAGSLLDASTTQVHAEYTYMIINHHKEEKVTFIGWLSLGMVLEKISVR